MLGGRVVQITSTTCQCDVSQLSPWAARAVYAGGCIANILTGLLVLVLQRLVRPGRSALRYATWLFGHVSLFLAAGYLMAFPFLPAGDWHDFVGGLPAKVIWQSGLTVLGVAGYAATMWHAQRSLGEFLGSDPRMRAAGARSLTLLPYLIGGTVETLSAIVGGAGILVGRHAGKTRSAGTSLAVGLPRAPVLLAAGLLAAALHLFWLGPGLLRH